MRATLARDFGWFDLPDERYLTEGAARGGGTDAPAKRCASQFNSGSERCISGRSSLGNMGRRLSSARRHWAAW